MNWFWWILLANGAIFFLEYVYRKGEFSSFLSALPYVIIPIMIGQLGLFYGFRVGGLKTLVLAGAVFTLMNSVLRLANSLILGEKLGVLSFVGVFVLAVGTILLSLEKV